MVRHIGQFVFLEKDWRRLLTKMVVKQPRQILCPQLVLTDATLSSKSTRQTGHSEVSSVHLGVVLVGETNRITCSGAGRRGGTYGGRGTAVGTGGGTGGVAGEAAGGAGGSGSGIGGGVRVMLRRARQREHLQFLA